MGKIKTIQTHNISKVLPPTHLFSGDLTGHAPPKQGSIPREKTTWDTQTESGRPTHAEEENQLGNSTGREYRLQERKSAYVPKLYRKEITQKLGLFRPQISKF